MNCILPRTARKTDFDTMCLLSCLWMTAPMSCFGFWYGRSRDSNGYYYVTALWVPYHIHTRYVMRSFPLCGFRVLHPAQYDLHNSTTIRVTAKKKQCPGCLAHAVTGMFNSVVANQRQPQCTYNVLQRRCQGNYHI